MLKFYSHVEIQTTCRNLSPMLQFLNNMLHFNQMLQFKPHVKTTPILNDEIQPTCNNLISMLQIKPHVAI